MSDRIASLQRGPDRAAEPPRDPTNTRQRVRGRFRRGSNAIERDGRKLTIRRRRSALIGEGEPADGLVTERGRIAESAYVGMVTRVKSRT